MRELIQLEIQRNKLVSYIKAWLIITGTMLAFLYLVAVIPRIEPQEAAQEIFNTYQGHSSLNGILYMAMFTIFTAVLYARFVVEEYAGGRALLLFSYPVNREKIFFSKIILVLVLSVGGALLSGIAGFSIFYMTEAIFPICQDVLSFSVIINTLIKLLVYSVMAAAAGSIALWFGFRQKSVLTTIISAVILIVVASQCLSAAQGSLPVAAFLTAISMLAAIILLLSTSKSVKTMEA